MSPLTRLVPRSVPIVYRLRELKSLTHLVTNYQSNMFGRAYLMNRGMYEG